MKSHFVDDVMIALVYFTRLLVMHVSTYKILVNCNTAIVHSQYRHKTHPSVIIACAATSSHNLKKN